MRLLRWIYKPEHVHRHAMTKLVIPWWLEHWRPECKTQIKHGSFG